MQLWTFVFLIVVAGSVTSTPISQEGLTSLCNVALSPLLNNEPSSIINVASSIQNSNAQTSLSQETLADQLYDSVIVGDYESAVTKSLRLEHEGKGQVIIDTVNKLLRNSQRNVVEFAYKLWNMFGRDIVKDYFPIQFRMLLNQNDVTFTNKKHEFPLTVVDNNDKDGNRLAYGDGKDRTNDRLRWNIKPIWEDNRVYFKILNTLRKQYLKLSIAANGAGEHSGYSADASDTYRQQWYLHPAMHEDELLFYITNREYNQALKLNAAVDNSGNRLLLGHKGEFIGNPQDLGWHIKPM